MQIIVLIHVFLVINIPRGTWIQVNTLVLCTRALNSFSASAKVNDFKNVN